MSTLEQRQGQARTYVCPRCHAEAGEYCKSQGGNNLSGRVATGVQAPRKHIKGVHPERLALLPFELTWHRVQGGWRAVDNRVNPHVIYSVYRDETRRDGRQWMLVSWTEGEETKAQRHEGISKAEHAKRMAMRSRCTDCGVFRPFGELVHKHKGLYHCADRETCEARVQAQGEQEHVELVSSRSEDHESIEFRTDALGLPQVVFRKGGNGTVVDLTRTDVVELVSKAARYLAGS